VGRSGGHAWKKLISKNMPSKVEEILGMKKVELTGNRKFLVDWLNDFLKKEGELRFIRQIIKSVEYGQDDTARLICWNEADKFRNLAGTIDVLTKYLFDDNEDRPWHSRVKPPRPAVKSEPAYEAPEARFKRLIDDRYELWVSIVDDSAIADEIKSEVKKYLLKLKEEAFTSWGNLADAFYGIKSVILTPVLRDRDQVEAMAMYENLRDDLNAFEKEIFE
jgi:hypothetical protein